MHTQRWSGLQNVYLFPIHQDTLQNFPMTFTQGKRNNQKSYQSNAEVIKDFFCFSDIIDATPNREREMETWKYQQSENKSTENQM